MMRNQEYTAADLSNQDTSDPTVPLLDQLNLKIGDPVQLQIGNNRHAATLVGYFKEQSVIVTAPEEKKAPSWPKEGQSLAVHLFSGKCAYSFETVVKQVATEPFPHLHLSYPQVIRALQERHYDRIKVNIDGTASISSGKRYPCVVQDISIGGALIALNDQTGGVNDPLLLTLRIAINGVTYELSLDSEIRSVRRVDSGAPVAGDGSPILQGLAFYDLSHQDILALAAFDLLPDWNASA